MVHLRPSARSGLRLFAVCRTQYASVCTWRGAEEAERELTSRPTARASCPMTGEGWCLGAAEAPGKLDGRWRC